MINTHLTEYWFCARDEDDDIYNQGPVTLDTLNEHFDIAEWPVKVLFTLIPMSTAVH